MFKSFVTLAFTVLFVSPTPLFYFCHLAQHTFSNMLVLRLAALAAASAHCASASVILRRDLTAPESPADGWEYLGCYIDSTSNRALNGPVHYDETGLTAETCVAHCVGLGYAFAGMEYSKECCK